MAAAIFSLFTVYVATYMACHRVEKLSPVEALKASESKGYRKKKKIKKVSWMKMAMLNLTRNLGKNVIVMISIVMAFVTFNCVIMLVQGFDFDEFLSIYMSSDFEITKCGPTLLNDSDLHGIDNEMKNTIEECPDLKSVSYVYYSKGYHELDEQRRKLCEKFYEMYKENYGEYEKSLWDPIFEKNQIRLRFMGINEAAFHKLEWEKGKNGCTWEEFASGNKVLLSDPSGFGFEEYEWHHVGELFTMQYQNGEAKTYEVLGETKLPSAFRLYAGSFGNCSGSA